MLLLLLPRARSDEHEHTVRRSEPRGRPPSAPPLAAPPGPVRPGGPLQPCGRPSAPSGRAWRGRIRGSWEEEEAFSSTPGGLGLAPRLRLSGLGPGGRPVAGSGPGETGCCGTQHGGRWMHRDHQALANQEIPIASRPASAFSHPSLSRPNRIQILGCGGTALVNRRRERFTRGHVFILHALGPQAFPVTLSALRESPEDIRVVSL